MGEAGNAFRHALMNAILICFGDYGVYLEMNDAFRCDLLSRACDPSSRACDPCRTFGLDVLFYQMM
jgi:hypothetical protein